MVGMFCPCRQVAFSEGDSTDSCNNFFTVVGFFIVAVLILVSVVLLVVLYKQRHRLTAGCCGRRGGSLTRLY